MKMIINATRGKTLCRQFRTCSSILSKSLGLMFTTPAYIQKHSLVFVFKKPRVQEFHMFFVFYPIDIIFLDSRRRVVDIKENFHPFRIYKSRQLSQYAIELPSGTIAKTKTRHGDKIQWRTPL
ncbi:DUF192 domain-containing protein [Candidatus Woesearchaeota archaeon]|nr:DUF192 domain-containing protein [Candidatus Woesearchaeota archaeon]